MTNKPLIALHGPDGAGKTTLAEHLRDKHGYHLFNFADPLYREVAEVFRVEESSLRDRATKEEQQQWLALFHAKDPDYRAFAIKQGHDLYTPRSPRFHLRLYGTEYTNRKEPKRWIRLLVESLDLVPGSSGIVIGDLRAYADLKEYRELCLAAAVLRRELLVFEVTREGRNYTEHQSNSRLPQECITCTIRNVEGRIKDTYLMVDSLISDPRFSATEAS